MVSTQIIEPKTKAVLLGFSLTSIGYVIEYVCVSSCMSCNPVCLNIYVLYVCRYACLGDRQAARGRGLIVLSYRPRISCQKERQAGKEREKEKERELYIHLEHQ